MGGCHCHCIELKVFEDDFGVALLDHRREARLDCEGEAALLEVGQELILIRDTLGQWCLPKQFLNGVGPYQTLETAILEKPAHLRMNDLLAARVEAAFLDIAKSLIAKCWIRCFRTMFVFNHCVEDGLDVGLVLASK